MDLEEVHEICNGIVTFSFDLYDLKAVDFVIEETSHVTFLRRQHQSYKAVVAHVEGVLFRRL